MLKVVPYKERSTILTLFTKEAGIRPCILFGSTVAKKQLATPLCHGEFILKSGKGMDTVSDSTLFSLQLHLRHSLPHLQTAGKIAHILNKTQLENKPSPALFELTIRCLQKLPEYDPNSILACFITKLLLHEGALSETHPRHAFSKEEWNNLITMASMKHFQQLTQCAYPPIDKLLQWITEL